MDLHKILSDLYQQRERLEEAILAMERLAQARGRRGRPSKLLASSLEAEEELPPMPKKRGRKPKRAKPE